MNLHQIQTHPEYVEGCFGCKVMTLELGTGDADSRRQRPQKAFNQELNAYSEARARGIQPGGTSMQKIREAEKASEVLGRPYNSNTMPDANKVNKSTVAVMKEIGQI